MLADLTPTCPAAIPLHGPPGEEPAVVCGVFRNRFDLVDVILKGDERGVLKSMAREPSTLLNYCCGRGVPVARARRDDDDQRSPHYTGCVVWQADRLLGWEEQEEEPEYPSLEEIVSGEVV